MLSLRAIARSAPRAMARVSAPSLRQLTTRPKTLGAVSSAVNNASRPCYAAFSTTVLRAAESSKNETDEELSGKLDSEIQIEEELKGTEQRPASIKDFLDNTPFELSEKSGRETVSLVRKYGDEKITVSFSIADIADYDPYPDDALSDEEPSDPSMQDANRQDGVPAAGGARSAPAQEQMDEEMDDDVDDDPAATPIHLTIAVEKPSKSKGALSIEAVASEGNISVQNVFYHEDAKAAKVDCPDATAKRIGAYPGPPFGTLDEDLQLLIERYLDERGINQVMAIFVADYVEIKEQKEYMRWLNNVKRFIDA